MFLFLLLVSLDSWDSISCFVCSHQKQQTNKTNHFFPFPILSVQSCCISFEDFLSRCFGALYLLTPSTIQSLSWHHYNRVLCGEVVLESTRLWIQDIKYIRLTSSELYINWVKQKGQTFVCSSFSNVRIYNFSLFTL